MPSGNISHQGGLGSCCSGEGIKGTSEKPGNLGNVRESNGLFWPILLKGFNAHPCLGCFASFLDGLYCNAGMSASQD